MAPTTVDSKGPHEDFNLKKELSWCLNEEIVISGMSGRFPDADTLEEFKRKLYDGVDMVNENHRRWPPGLYGLPKRIGTVKSISRFDAQSFGVNAKMAHEMDPIMRMLIEVTQETILDAGINPISLKGSRTGVFNACSYEDSYAYWSDNEDRVHGYGMLGGSKAMIANRISFTFDFKGPSYTVDSSCSSSLLALQQAMTAIRTGIVDSAVVCSGNIIALPTKSLCYKRMNLLPNDDVSKPLDNSSDGFERSEAVVACFLQKRKSAKRVYATVLSAVAGSDGLKHEGFTNVSYQSQVDTLSQALKDANVKPHDVQYVETHAMGTQIGDSAEANAVAEVFCKDRKEPLLVGSVKSNMGHAEAASGLCSLVKVLLAMETGVIAPNIHYDHPNKYVPALLNSEMKVVTEPAQYRGGVVAVNSIGLSGTNSTVLLASNPIVKTKPKDIKTKFHLICASGRNSATVESTLDKIVARKEDEEFLALVNDIYSKNIPGYDYKGYAVVTDHVVKEIQSASGASNRPIWYVFAGMGSQWAGMARDLIKVPICEKAIRKLHELLLKTENYNLLSVLLSEDESTFDNILNSLTCIAAVQIALVDFLTFLGITPDGMIGHSAGEVGCAYADGALTDEETVFTAYYRGRSILEADLDAGAMAAIGLTWEEIEKRVPEGIYAACHNSDDSVTISGPPNDIKIFVDRLKSEGVFAREIKSSGCAFHSKYVAKAGPIYKRYLEKVIKKPKLRTCRWISTSNDESTWNIPSARYSGADYHVGNLLNPVLFQEAFKYIPENAIIIEIAPHHLMQAILKRAFGPNVTILGLVKRLHTNNLEFLLSNIGKFYLEGGQPKLNNLLANVQFPVARGTTMIQSIIEWDHSFEWTVPDFSDMVLQRTGVCDVNVDLTSDEYAYISGHVVDGRIVLPGVGYVEIAWKVFAKLNGQHYMNFPIVFENVRFLRATIIPENGSVTLTVSYLAGENKIEISEGSTVIVRANVRKASSFDEERFQYLPPPDLSKKDAIILTNKADIYKYFVKRGFSYSDDFMAIREYNDDGYYTTLEFRDRYPPFMDTLIQCTEQVEIMHLPIGIGRILIDPITHRRIVDAAPKDKDGTSIVPLSFYKNIRVSISGGVEMRDIILNATSAKTIIQHPSLEKHIFVPFMPQQTIDELSTEQLMKLFTDLVIENHPGAYELKVIEYAYDRSPKNLHALIILQTIESVPLNKIDADVTVITDHPDQISPSFVQNGIRVISQDASNDPFDDDYHFIVTENVSSDDHLDLLNKISDALLPGGFILIREELDINRDDTFEKFGFQLVSDVSNDEYRFCFWKKPSLSTISKYIYIDEMFKWIDDLQSCLKMSKENGRKILLIGEKQSNLGILGFFNCLKREPGNINVRCLFIPDTSAPAFTENDPFYVEQLKKDLTVNIYKDGQWGSYRHVSLPIPRNNKVNTLDAFANTAQRGDLGSINWIQEAPSSYRIPAHIEKKLCRVHYASITDNDILMASLKGSKYPNEFGLTLEEEYMGMEFSGKDETGKRVMGLVKDKAVATTVFADAEFLWDIPEHWSLEEACTVPLPYSVAYYALYVCGKIESTDSILIHEANTLLAQAAISICLNLGCKIFVTGTEAALTYLRSVYPQIPDESLISTDTSALDYVLNKKTKGKGVNLILNSIGDDIIRRYFNLLQPNGKFLDTRKVEDRYVSYDNEFIKRNVTYFGIYVEAFFKSKTNAQVKKTVAKLVEDGIINGSVVPFLTIPFTELEKAISFVNDGNYTGKVVVEIKEEEPESDNSVDSLIPGRVLALRRSYFDPNKSYIVLGGLGGFGVELCEFLVSRYAKKLIIVSRNGVKTPLQRLLVFKLQQKGVNVIISNLDASTYDGAEQLIKQAATLGPIGGIFNLAGVLRDSIFENQTAEDFQVVCKPKVKTTLYLDEVSRKLCPQLDYFVVFSSVSCGRGNAGQTNYGLANSAMDRICESRQAAGYPATSIQWGAIGDVGMLLEKFILNPGTRVNQEIGGMLPQKLFSSLSTFDYLIQLPDPVVSSVVLAQKVKTTNVTQLQPAGVVANILGIKDVETVNRSATLVELGTDSLTNVEIKQTLERKFRIVVSAQDVLQLTFEKIDQLAAESSSS